MIYGLLAMGWRGSARHWHRYQSAYLLLAGLATPLVLSVHTVVSFDFSVAIVPGWHTTIFPPYFVAGAIYSGFAMVLTIAIPLRKAYDLEDFITMRHLENMAKVMLATGLDRCVRILLRIFHVALQRQQIRCVPGAAAAARSVCAVLLRADFVQHFDAATVVDSQKVRTNVAVLFVMSLVINIGMWLERFVIVVISLTRDFMPSRVGPLSADVLGLGHVHRNARACSSSLIFLFVRVLAGHFHCGNARTGGASTRNTSDGTALPQSTA